MTGDPLRFTGQEIDAESGQHYFQARQYRNIWGRFTTVDPFIDVDVSVLSPQAWNRYAYAWGNPLRFVDPSGLTPCEFDGSRLDCTIDVIGNTEPTPLDGSPDVVIPLDLLQPGQCADVYIDNVFQGNQCRGYGGEGSQNPSPGGGGGTGAGSGVTIAEALGAVVEIASALPPGRGLSLLRFLGTTLKLRLPARAVRYGPLNPGPLPAGIVGTFRGGSYSGLTLNEPTTFYRVYGGTAEELGAFWTRTPQSGGLQSAFDLALDPRWGNNASKIVKIRVPAGTRIFEGAAASQRGLLGGGSQVFIPGVSHSWIVP
jgi:RHS repeat-associated protein